MQLIAIYHFSRSMPHILTLWAMLITIKHIIALHILYFILKLLLTIIHCSLYTKQLHPWEVCSLNNPWSFAASHYLMRFINWCTWKQWRSYPLDLVDKARGGTLLEGGKCDNVLNEQRQTCVKISLARPSNEVVNLDLAPLSVKVESKCYIIDQFIGTIAE